MANWSSPQCVRSNQSSLGVTFPQQPFISPNVLIMPERERPYTNGNFRVKIGGDQGESVSSGFQEVIMPEVTTEVVEYRNGNEKRNRPRKITGGYDVGNVILKRGIIKSDILWAWFVQVQNGKQRHSLKDAVIELRNESGEEVAVVWHLTNARPVKYRFSDLEVGGEEIALEIVEFACEDIDMEFE